MQCLETVACYLAEKFTYKLTFLDTLYKMTLLHLLLPDLIDSIVLLAGLLAGANSHCDVTAFTIFIRKSS